MVQGSLNMPCYVQEACVGHVDLVPSVENLHLWFKFVYTPVEIFTIQMCALIAPMFMFHVEC